MRRIRLPVPIVLFAVPLVAIFVACAGSDEDGSGGPTFDAGSDDTFVPDSAAPDATDDGARDVDAEALRCSAELCLVDLPNPGAYGFTRWSFRGVQVDPVIGAWAIASGELGVDSATAQLLRFDGAGWKAMHAPVLGAGADRRSIRLSSLAADGAGKLLAVGSAIDDGTGAIVRGDGASFTTETFDVALEAVWFAEPGVAWAVGRAGAIYRSTPDAGWISESAEQGGDFVAVWGSGPDDVYVGGSKEEDYLAYGYLGHRTPGGDGGATWTFGTFPELQPRPFGDHTIYAGVAVAGGARFWSAPDVLARGATDAGATDWSADPFDAPVAMNAFWARAANDIWAVGNVGRVYHFDGASWKDMRLVFNGAPLVANLTGIAGTSAGELFIVGDGIALRRKAP